MAKQSNPRDPAKHIAVPIYSKPDAIQAAMFALHYSRKLACNETVGVQLKLQSLVTGRLREMNEKMMWTANYENKRMQLTFVQDRAAGMMVHVGTFLGSRCWEVSEAVAVARLITFR